MLLNIATPIIMSFIGLTFIGVFIASLWMFFIPKRDVIETSENILKIGLALYTNVIYILFLCFHSVYVFLEFDYKEKSYIDIVIILIAIFPSISLIFNYFNLNRLFKKKFKLIKTEKEFFKEDNKEIKSCIEEISETLELKKKPKILFSKFKNISPIVFGKTSRKSYITLPRNWFEILKKVSGDNKRIENSLKRFVILHELSHIKHRDHIFIGSSYAFLRSFKYWIVVVILSATTFSFIIGLPEVRYSFGPILFGVVYYLILFLLTMSVSRSREYIADARASLFVSKGELDSIIEKKVDFKGQRISYLEILFNWFSLFSRLKTSSIGISGSQTSLTKALEISLGKLKNIKIKEKLSRLSQKVIYTHPSKESRLQKLEERYFIGETRNIISYETAMWTGAILGLFFSIANFYPLQINQLLFSAHKIEGLFIIELGDFLYFFLAVFIPFLFYIPLRNSTTITISFMKYFISLTVRFFIVYVAFCITNVLLSSIIYLNQKMYIVYKFSDFIKNAASDFFGITPVFIGGFFLTAIFVFLHFNFVSYTYNVRSSEKKGMFFSVISVFVSLIIFTLFLNFLIGLNILSIICGFFVGISVFYYLDIGFPLIINFDEKWEVYGNQNFIRKSDRKGIINLLFWQVVFTCYLPMTITAFITNHIESLTIYLILSYASFGFFFYLIFKNRKLNRPSYGNITLFLESIHRYLFILKALYSSKIHQNRDLVHERVQSYRSADNFYTLHRRMNIGNTNTTYNAVTSLELIHVNNKLKKSAEWLLICENVRGGFSPIPSLKSRLSSTYEALSVLDKYNLIKGLNTEGHLNWLKSLQKEEGFFHDSISKFPKIEQTFHALSSLYFLGRLDVINKKECIDWIRERWKSGKKDFEFVFFSVKCLELLGELDEESKREVRDDWLLPNSSVLRRLKFDKNLSPFYFYFKVAEIVMKDKIENIKNLVPDLEERAYSSFIYYINKR